MPVRRLKSLNVDWNYRLPRPAWKKALWHALENFNPRAFLVMRREIRRFRPDVVLTDSIENVNVATWAAAKSCGLPTVHILRSAFLLCWKASMRKGDANCGRACGSCQASSVGKKLSSRFVDAVVGETAFIVGRHLEHGYFPNASTHVVPGAVRPVDGAAPRPAPRGRPVRFGFIGVHDPVKGLDTLAAAARRLEARDDVEFVIAGSGPQDYAARLRDAFPARTRFLGWTRPEDFFPEIDVLVVPSLFREPFGRVVVEAFAQGTPVIGARSGGIPESIEEGVSGAIVEPGDDEGLAGAIAALADDRDEIARLSAGALRAAARYRPEAIAARFDAVFASLRPAPTSARRIDAAEARA
ncbi:glycosyltransferase [Chenggangzhangella methanolivorans]|uniref:glycosyltransferase n=1 Tax=Chenggangzhangella methanolivorans TaxID=1437009 RepID=UPI0021BDB6D8|nr:glycosyltransferase [Chenggangzhangella methanolivorans]